MNKRILRRSAGNDVSGLEDFHPLLKRVFAARDINQAEEVDKTLSALLPYYDLLHINRAVERLTTALQKQEPDDCRGTRAIVPAQCQILPFRPRLR